MPVRRMTNAELAGVPSLDTAQLRRALSTFLTGVTVATTLDDQGRPRGLTVNSFTSVSLQPPLVLVCIDENAASHEIFGRCEGFGINILADSQLDLSHRFASKLATKFEGIDWRPSETGAVLINGSAAWMDCSVHERRPVGDHLMLIGEVRGFGHEPLRPLAYCQGQYLSLSPERVVDIAADRSSFTRRWLVEAANGLLLARTDAGAWDLPSRRGPAISLDDRALAAEVSTLASATHVEAPFLFSVYDDRDGQLVLVYRTRATEALTVAEPQRLFLPAELPWGEFASEVTEGLLRRYLRERDSERFGIYVGSSERGRVAPFSDPPIDYETYLNPQQRR